MSRNPGLPLDPDWIAEACTDEQTVNTRADRIANRTPETGERKAARCLQALACLDLTTLSSDDTAARVGRLCARARAPLPPDLAGALGLSRDANRTAGVCVYHRFIGDARRALAGTGVRVCTVSAGFPHGLSPLAQRVDEVRASVREGADEIDVAIMRAHVLTADWSALYEEIREFRAACGDTILKVILATGDLGTLANVARASRVAMMAGADFLKTSTGMEKANATLPAGLAMAEEILKYRDRTGIAIGLKPAGGIRTVDQALDWLALADEELGPEWGRPERFRLGASSLLDALESQLRLRPSS